MKPRDLRIALEDTAFEAYENREKLIGSDVMRQLERYVLLMTIDEQWRENLYALDGLKEGIGLRSYAQKDPLIEYKREAFGLFTELLDRIDRIALERLFRAQIAPPPPDARREGNIREVHQTKNGYGVSSAGGQSGRPNVPPPRRAKAKPIYKGKKVGRNDPCPCGSGKKYKNCCGRR